jgi:hypothetical protein
MKPTNTRTRPVQMCCVQIGYSSYLMPADKGMKVVEMLQAAFECRKDYAERGYVYIVGNQPEVELALVRSDQVRKPVEQPSEEPPRLLAAPRQS